jgi:sugar/nucleoside kinase (ribokinase family)
MADVYCFGHVSTGIVVRLDGPYPAAEGYGEIVEQLENHSGEAAGTAVTLARLGWDVVLEGNWIGDSPECRRTLGFHRDCGIDCSGLVVRPGYPGATEIVISDGATRTVFGRYVDLLGTAPQWPDPDLDRVVAARVVVVDPGFAGATPAVALAAHRAGRPLVTCDVRADVPLAEQASCVVVSNEFLRREYPGAEVDRQARAELFDRYLARCPGLVVFTDGADPLWYGRGDIGSVPGGCLPGVRHERPSFPVSTVDTAGAGDSFRGGVVHGMLQGWSDTETLRFAAAVAALVCTTSPGVRYAPTLSEVESFLAGRG